MFTLAEADCVGIAYDPSKVGFLANLLFHSSIEARVNSTAMVEMVVVWTRCSDLRPVVSWVEEILEGDVEMMRNSIPYPRALKIGIKAMFALCLAKQTRHKAVSAGAGKTLVDRLPDFDKCDAERALATVELLCAATEYAAGALLALCSASEIFQAALLALCSASEICQRWSSDAKRRDVGCRTCADYARSQLSSSADIVLNHVFLQHNATDRRGCQQVKLFINKFNASHVAYTSANEIYFSADFIETYSGLDLKREFSSMLYREKVHVWL
ncbi:unnamed protein product [Linum trigynum]|uniref:U-box domain-containing protein n=1 Tax=Linum trigynum TaxID=586398 RepID=A0AAV2ETG2_9ROSI